MEDFNLYNVYQEKDYNIIRIYFSMNEMNYSLSVLDSRDAGYHPWNVWHESNQPCPFCQESNEESTCLPLKEHKQQLFHQLIALPNLRLEWLFIPHEEGVEK